MVKASRPPIPLAVLSFALLVGACAGSKSRAVPYALPFDLSEKPAKVEELWSEEARGLISDLSLARDADTLLIATVPNPESSGQEGHHLQAYDAHGRVRWRVKLDSPVKAQDISRDGSLAVIAQYSHEVSAFDSGGKRVWSVEGSCRPIVRSRAKRVLCYHDDAISPEVGFEEYDWKGRKTFSYPVRQDVLSLEVSEDEASIALGKAGGTVTLLGDGHRQLWEKKVAGEVADLAVSSGSDPRVAVLFNSRRDGQRIAVLGAGGKLLAEVSPESYVKQVEISPDGGSIATYGNGPQGQCLALYDPKLKKRWRRMGGRIADYASPMVLRDGVVIIGFEDKAAVDEGTARTSHLLAFDFEGRMKWNIPVVTQDGAYVYAQGFAPDRGFVAIGTDDARLLAYRLER